MMTHGGCDYNLGGGAANHRNGQLGSGLVLVGEGGLGRLSGTIVTNANANTNMNLNINPAALPLSVQRNVDRIVANPRAAEREVEDTMDALRNRYRQLQERLEKRRKERQEAKKKRQPQTQSQPRANVTIKQQHQPLSLSPKTAESSDAPSSVSLPQHPIRPRIANDDPLQQSHHHRHVHKTPLLIRKRVINLPIHHRQHHSGSSSPDENSSVSSNVSSIAASRTDLGNEEIVALEVLGEALPRGDSINDLQVLERDSFAARSIRGDNSSIEEGVTSSMLLQFNNDNHSSSSCDFLAPMASVSNDSDHHNHGLVVRNSSNSNINNNNNNLNHRNSINNGQVDDSTANKIKSPGK